MLNIRQAYYATLQHTLNFGDLLGYGLCCKHLGCKVKMVRVVIGPSNLLSGCHNRIVSILRLPFISSDSSSCIISLGLSVRKVEADVISPNPT